MGRNKYIGYKINNRETMLEQFQNYTKQERSTGELIEFLSMLNSRCLAMLHVAGDDITQLAKKTQEEILEFADYFEEQYDEKTVEARYENWDGQDALVLRVANAIHEIQTQKEAEEIYSRMSEGQKAEVESFTDTLFNIRRDREMSFIWEDGYDIINVAGTMPRRDLADCRKMIKALVTHAISGHGAVVVREYARSKKNPQMQIYGYRINPFGVWDAISAQEMETCHCTSQTGEWLGPEENVVYTTRPREREVK